MDRHNILSLLGLAMRGGRLAVGEEPVEAAARARDARVLLLAADAAEGTRRRCEHFAAHGDCLWLQVPFTKEELGRALGRTSVALAAVTDVGLADALLRRLAELDPDRYREASERMAVKARRAAERKAEQAAHDKNVRRGRRRAKEAPAAEKKPSADSSAAAERRKAAGERPRKAAAPQRSRPPRGERLGPRAQTRFAHSRPVKKGKGSFRKKKES